MIRTGDAIVGNIFMRTRKKETHGFALCFILSFPVISTGEKGSGQKTVTNLKCI